MSSEAVKIWPLVADRMSNPGPVIAAYGPMRGGYITNPLTATEQGIPAQENLYVDFVAAATLMTSRTTTPLPPGYTLPFPANFEGEVSVNAATPGHRFSGVVYQPDPGFQESGSPFPPPGQTSLTKSLPQYLYQQYNDDEDLLAFVDAFNSIVQEYMDFLSGVNLPVYTGLTGELLDLVMEGVYGIDRPVLPYGVGMSHGPLNTITLNSHVLNAYEIHGPAQYFLTTDDTYKRIGTWYKWIGDGKQFNIRWAKRRIKRFLTGTDGGPGDTSQTYDVGITFGVDGEININLQSTRRFSTFGSMMNVGVMNGFQLNELDTASLSVPVSQMIPIFKAAVEAGVLKFPFQLTPIVNVN